MKMRSGKRLLLLLSLVLIEAAGALLAGGATMAAITVTSPAFTNGGAIPAKFTCDGADVSPELAFGAVPPGTRSLALIVDDPHAPGGMWVHWVVWNIDPATKRIAEDGVPPGAQQGLTDFRRNSYGGPCPPSGTHRYFFKLYALDATLDLGAGSTKASLEKAMKGHVLAQGELMGKYKRK